MISLSAIYTFLRTFDNGIGRGEGHLLQVLLIKVTY